MLISGPKTHVSTRTGTAQTGTAVRPKSDMLYSMYDWLPLLLSPLLSSLSLLLTVIATRYQFYYM